MSSAEATVTVAVLASEPLLAQGATACLRACPGITLVPPDDLDRASVVLVIDGQVGEKTLSFMRQAAGKAADRERRFVLVCDAIAEPQLVLALSWGLVSVLPRQNADYEQIAGALADAHAGKFGPTVDAPGGLEERIRSVRGDVVAPPGLAQAGLYAREIEVLRLLGEGLDTLEIAQRLSYSERTVRNIIQGLLSRMRLRNRVHAVAYALRNGVM